MWSKGHWQDFDYDACVFQGARCKRQRLRHNIEEIDMKVAVQCRHIHSKEEWKPFLVDGKRHYPSHDEAEYTAALAYHIAVSASWWAARTGRAQLRVPRSPPISCTGDRRAWLDWDSRATRQWSMVSTAVLLGLDLSSSFSLSHIPRRRSVSEFDLEELKQSGLPEGHIYVGPGHHSHRLPSTRWKARFVPGQHGSREECFLLYVQWLKTSELPGKLEELYHQTLVCDCAPHQLCHADALIAEAATTTIPQVRKVRGGLPRATGRRWVCLAGMPTAQSMPWTPGMHFVQEVLAAFRKLYPPQFTAGLKEWPLVEDLLNQPPFTIYKDWRLGNGLQVVWIGKASLRAKRELGYSREPCMAHRAALPPVVSYGLDPDLHFQAAIAAAGQTLPTEQPICLDHDLLFAADFTWEHRGRLEAARMRNLGVLKELSRRWQVVTKHLRQFQPSGVARVTNTRHIALVALLLLIVSWPDHMFAVDLATGFPAVAYAPPCGAFAPRDIDPIHLQSLFADVDTTNAALLSRLRPGALDGIMLESGLKDASKGFATEPLTWEQLQRQVQRRPVRLIPRFPITQSTGKVRPIDDADKGGQSELSADANHLEFCSALRPAPQHVWALQQAAVLRGGTIAGIPDQLHSAGKDWPDAYRLVPMIPQHAEACVVVFWHPE